MRGLIPPEAGIVCAVSGGADSMALLHALIMVNFTYDYGWNLLVAHLDHTLRSDSAADAIFVRQQADEFSLPCLIQRTDVAAGRAAGESLEEAARRVRYAFLEEAAETLRKASRGHPAVVAVGHHAEDQAETVLHHILRGTGLRGLAGMPVRRPIRWGSSIELVRPLLGFRRAELLGYLKRRGRPYRVDSTNADSAAARRNLIRHQVLPLIQETVNPEAVTALLRLAEQARRAEDVIRFCAAEALERSFVRQEKDALVLRAALIAALPKAIRSEIIVSVLRRLGAPLQEVGFERIEAAADAAGRAGRRVIELPGGVTVQRRKGELWIHTPPHEE